MWEMSDQQFIDLAIDELDKINVISKADVKDSVRIKVKKAYPAYFDTYSRIDELIAYLNGISNLYCIGRNGQHRYNNMDHSMLCGIEAARALLGNGSKSTVWNVNTEEEYHEGK